MKELKAKDFRIENLVLYKSDLVKIKSINEETIIVKRTACTHRTQSIVTGYDKIESISLSEEWAVKFGYECILELVCDMNDNNFDTQNLTTDSIKGMPIHTIQNLYFALTGKELELT